MPGCEASADAKRSLRCGSDVFVAGRCRGSLDATGGGLRRSFTGATMRVDYFHSGGMGQEIVALDRIVSDGPWPGSRTRLIDDLNLGKYLFEVIDRDTNRRDLLARLRFHLWRMGDDGRGQDPAPDVRRVAAIAVAEVAGAGRPEERDRDNSFHELWSTVIDPDFAVRQPRRSTQSRHCLDPVRERSAGAEGGHPAHQRGLHGSADAEVPRRCETARGRAVRVEPFQSRKNDFNVRGLELPSASRRQPPARRLVPPDAVSAEYNIFDSERYLLTLDNRAFRDAAAPRRTSSSRSWPTRAVRGGGIFNDQATTAVDTGFAEYVFVHEFGHHFAGLADEYYTSDVAYETARPTRRSPGSRTHALKDPGRLKWRDLVEPGTPLRRRGTRRVNPQPRDAGPAAGAAGEEGAGIRVRRSLPRAAGVGHEVPVVDEVFGEGRRVRGRRLRGEGTLPP